MIVVEKKKVRRRDYRVWYLVSGVFIAVFLFTFLTNIFKNQTEEVDAVNLASFDPGYIISDYQMSNYNSMNETEIQKFLKSKNSCNDANINKYTMGDKVSYFSEMMPPRTWHVANGHFICLADEDFNGESAAHIIYQAAQDYKINPQALIVLLEKEQSLITDTFPHSGQYRSAAGYGCPDTAACSSKYYGFKNQIRNAAALFRTVLDGGWTNYPLGNNYVQYNPSASCGGSVVNIRNLATSALYRYTPYQPNTATLNGWNDGCNAYGNLNFYKLFEDWFGGITNSRVEWQEMQNPRIMTINKSTLLINANDHSLTTQWLDIDESYYFTRKVTLFWGGEQQACLQRKIDEGTNNCVLMSRLSDFSIDEKVTVLPEERQYEIEKWTCVVNVLSQEAECGSKSYSVGDVISADKTIRIDDKDYLITEGDYGVLKARTRLKLDYETIGPVLMKLTTNTYKYIGGEDKKVQSLNAGDGVFINVMDKTIINNEVFYRTVHDHNNNYNYVIPGSALTEDILMKFKYPRNLEFIKGTNSINLDSGESCRSYTNKMIRRFVNKVSYNGVDYFQDEDEKNTHCVVKASELRETKYDFGEEDSSGFMNFVFPRELKVNDYIYMIDAKSGKTCNDFLQKDDSQKYTTKIIINGMVFYRTETKTQINSSCVVPATNLIEIN